MVDNLEAKVYERLRAGESIESIANSFTQAMNKANTRYKEERKAEADRQIQVNRLLDLLNSLRDYIYDYSPVDVSDLLEDEPVTREVAEEGIDVLNSVIEQIATQMRNFACSIKNTDVEVCTAEEPTVPGPHKSASTPEERIANWLRRNNL